MCDWLKDKFGYSWQIVPTQMGHLMTGEPEKRKRAFDALMKMQKLDIAELVRAFQGEAVGAR
jgi:predicted 3-demethylubiquinone-9 3-methyltransferase (glyoxalase superfamily)